MTLEKLKQHLKLLLILVILVSIIAGIGYFFAKEKSEPVYLSKIDKLMFDEKNKSPKYIITIADKKLLQEIEEKENIILDKLPDVETLTMETILSNIPSLNKLKLYATTQDLEHTNLNNDLIEEIDNLQTPIISSSGRKPWVEYGKQVKILPNFKKVAIIIKNLGLNEMELDFINNGFPSEVSYSLSPYSQDIKKKILQLRNQGHETYIDMLLPSKDYLKSDAGPVAMNLTISAEESKERLIKSLSVGAPIGGVVINDGVADESNSEILTKVLAELKSRGLLAVDSTLGNGIDSLDILGLARTKANIIIEGVFDTDKINELLQDAENIALAEGQVSIVIEPKPIILNVVNDWIETFSPQLDYEESKDTVIAKPFALVPISNLVVE